MKTVYQTKLTVGLLLTIPFAKIVDEVSNFHKTIVLLLNQFLAVMKKKLFFFIKTTDFRTLG